MSEEKICTGKNLHYKLIVMGLRRNANMPDSCSLHKGCSDGV